ncbi:MAG: SxtJ family membrane protein [Steroidobacteraceae bacterium]
MARQTQIPLPTDRSFGITFAVVFALVGAWLLWKESEYSTAALIVAAIFLLAAFAFPKVLRPLNVAWMHLGLLLNRVVSPIVMGVIFFGLLTPLAAILRLRGRDVLQRSFDPARESYWVKRNPPGPDGSSFPRQF